MAPSRTFHKFFVKGQLRVETLFPEERALLKKFSELTGMVITDMGELDLDRAGQVAEEIAALVASEAFQPEEEQRPESETTWVCPVCGYRHQGETPPEKCPLCGVPGERFVRQ